LAWEASRIVRAIAELRRASDSWSTSSILLQSDAVVVGREDIAERSS
jgi:hypothetical protein